MCGFDADVEVAMGRSVPQSAGGWRKRFHETREAGDAGVGREVPRELEELHRRMMEPACAALVENDDVRVERRKERAEIVTRLQPEVDVEERGADAGQMVMLGSPFT